MSDNSKAAVVKVKYFRKRTKQLDKLEFTHSDYLKIRKWFMTGTFTNKFLLNDDIDMSLIGLIKLIITHEPMKIFDIITETYDKSLNKNTFIYTLVLLSNSTFESKRVFKSLFDKIIKTPKDLYRFMGFCKKERGFGQVIHNAIKDWFHSHDTPHLERMFVEYRSFYGWNSKDVMRLIKPKPTNHKEQLLYHWLSQDNIDKYSKEDCAEYKQLSYIIAYEKMRNDLAHETEIIEYIKTLGFKNSMIPGNIKRTKKIISSWITNFESKELAFNNIPRYLDSINGEAFDNLSLFLSNKQNTNRLSLFTIMSTYLGIKDVASSAQEMNLLNDLENILIDRLKRHSDKTTMNLIDTNDDMFSGKVNNLPASPAIVSSILTGYNFSMDYQGNKIIKKNTRCIVEAERRSTNSIFPNYNKIFESLNENKEINFLIVWSNKDSINKEIFIKRFDHWKNENKRIMKLVFINLGLTKKINTTGTKDIYTINEKTEKLIDFIKNGEI